MSGWTHRQRLVVFWALTVLFSINMIVALTGVWYTNREARKAERAAEEQARIDQRKICGIVNTMNDAYKANPPTTPIGRQLAEGMAQYRKDLGC